MFVRSRTRLSLTLLAAAALPLLPSTPPEPAAAGPGAVLHAVRAFVEAIDAGDTAAIAGLITDRDRGVSFAMDAGGAIEQLEDSGLALFEVAADGRPLRGDDPQQFARMLGSDTVRGGADARVRTVLHEIRAACPSADCSYAVVEFDRVYGDGESRRVVPMRATALLAWVGGEGAGMRLFHWHAARAGAVSR